jgi:drug/metabolite transporter (DMT)-like permease
MVEFSIPSTREVLAINVAFGIFGVIFIALRPKGPWVPLATCVFIVAIVAQRLLMKQLFSEPFEYRFPAFVTTLHFLSVWIICWLYFACTGDMSKCMPRSLGTVRRYLVYIIPISCSVPLSVVLNNQALLYMGAGLNGIFSTLTPLTTALVSHMLGRRIARAGWGALLIAFTGAVIIASGKFKSSSSSKAPLVGMSFALAAMALRSLKVVLQDRILEPAAYAGREKEEKQGQPTRPSTPMHVWALQAPVCTLISLGIALFTEKLGDAKEQLTPQTGSMILVTCMSATGVNLLGMYNVKNLGATFGQVVGQLNTILLVSFSVAFLGETFPPQVVVGTAFLLAGVSAYQLAEASGGSGAKLAASILAKRDSLVSMISLTPRPTTRTSDGADVGMSSRKCDVV